MYQNQLNAACIPFNFVQLEEINEQTGDLHTTLLYATLYFQIQKSKLLTHGTKTIARSREQLASFLNMTTSKIDKMIKELESLNLIRKTVGKWRNKKRLFISTVTEAPDIEVHFRKLMFLNQYIGNYKASLLWAKIAFALNKSSIEHNGLIWCTLKRETLAKLLCVSLRTVDSIIERLVDKGLIHAQNFIWNGKRRLHFTIPVTTYTQIVEELKDWLNNKESAPTQKTSNIPEEKQTSVTEKSRVEEPKSTLFLFKKKPNSHFCTEEPAKMEKSIRLNKNIQYKNNNTVSLGCSKKERFDRGDINLNYIASELTRRQLHFLQAAFNKTLKVAQLTVSNDEELFEEIKYSILNPQQRRAVTTFKHAVSRCMQLLRQGTWRTPFGFNRYTDVGVEIKANREAWSQAQEISKKEECESSSDSLFKIRTKTQEVTAECIRWAQQLRMYIAEMNALGHNNKGLQTKIEFAGNKILELVNKGADRVAIKPYLPI